MPTYDYECQQGHRFEVFQKMSDDPVAQCPECGADASRKISGGAGFLFKGEGFYITDYRSDEYRKKASAESPSGVDAAASGAKTEAPGSKAEPSTKAEPSSKKEAGGSGGSPSSSDS